MGGQNRLMAFTNIMLAAWLTVFVPCDSYKILVAPLAAGFNSRLLNMQKMADMLAQDGHEVTVLMNSVVKDHIITKNSNVVSYDISGNISDIKDMSMEDLKLDGFSFLEVIKKFVAIQKLFCENLFSNKVIMKSLREAHYDLFLGDMFSICNTVLASHLNTTTIWYQNYGFTADSGAFYPQFPSFTCHAMGTFCLSDEMTFGERILNTVFLVGMNYLVSPLMKPMFYKLAQDAGLELHSPPENIFQNSVMMVNVDFVLDPPRPTMPHVFTISGLFIKKPSPLDSHFQKIIDQAGPHGVVLLSFGTLVPKFDSRIAEMFANVFGRLKQQVIWRYTGQKPKGLQNNTHLEEWFPQNDLLANPAVKLFITHCGISSTFESAYSGVPVLAMPLFADQTYNAKKLTERVKMGIELDYYSVTEEQFEAGIKEVLSNPIYANNAKRASLVMSDQLVSPVQKFRHLVNFTIKSGGAKHLFHPYAPTMSWFTFYGLDVILFLLSTIVLFLAVTITILRAIYRLIFQEIKQKKE